MRTKLSLALLALAVAVAALVFFRSPNTSNAVRVGISPYQDLAMLVNYKPLGLDKKYATDVELVTMAWEEILPAVGSAGRTIDIGFGSYMEYLTKVTNLNAGSADPVLFIYPLYVFKGGAFVSFNKDPVVIKPADLADKSKVASFLDQRIGAQKSSIYDMMIFHLARLGDVPAAKLKITDTPLDQGFLAAEQGSLDVASAGLTQLTEAERRGGKAVLTMEDLGFADITGFIARKSVYEKKKTQIDNVIRMWFDSVAHVYADIDKNSKDSLAYLDKTASTRYSLDSYKAALAQEYLPTTLAEAQQQLIADDGKFAYRPIGKTAVEFLLSSGSIKSAPELPQFTPLN